MDELTFALNNMSLNEKKVFNKDVDRLSNLLEDMSLNEVDNMIGRMEKMRITKNVDDDVVELLNVMENMNMVPTNSSGMDKLNNAILKSKSVRNKRFLSHKGMAPVTQQQIDDAFAQWDKIKQSRREDGGLSTMFEGMNMSGRGKRKKPVKKSTKKPVKKSTKKPVKKKTNKKK
jgi:hypothetical protein